jgi:hypothetical protein
MPTDHKPLLGFFLKGLQAVENRRIQSVRDALMVYNFTVSHIPGKYNVVADALSRYPPCGPDTTEDPMSEAQCHLVRTEMRSARLDPLLVPIFAMAAQDPIYQMIVDDLRKGTRYKDLPRGHPGHQHAVNWCILSLLDAENATLVIQDAHRMLIP